MKRLYKADQNAIDEYRNKPPLGDVRLTRMCQECKEFRPMKGGKVTGQRANSGIRGFVKGAKTRFVCARCCSQMDQETEKGNGTDKLCR